MSAADATPLDVDAIAAREPKILWVELTSKCPFRCTFCSRELLRGDGEHLDFEVFRALVAGLERPEVFRLQVAGESMHYPHIIEAIRLAKSTGATVELTSTVSSMPDGLMRDLLLSGIDLLTVSVHTTDPRQYREIYGFSSFANLRDKLGRLVALKRELGLCAPVIDFSFVAMRANLEQLPAVAALAVEMQVDGINVHRVLRAAPIQATFADELEHNQLTEPFKRDLHAQVQRTQAQFPQLRVVFVNNAAEANEQVTAAPRFHAGLLPAGARIATCIENPWETIHVFANGDTYACCFGGLLPEYEMGSLRTHTIRELWNSPRYQAYRRRYASGQLEICKRCCWKKAYYPAPVAARYEAAHGPTTNLVRGYYEPEAGVVWSKVDSVLELARPDGAQCVRVVGLLPNAAGRPPAVLTLRANGRLLGTIRNDGSSMLDFDRRFPLPQDGAASVLLSISASSAFSPRALGLGPDRRQLGFALIAAEVGDDGRPPPPPAGRWRSFGRLWRKLVVRGGARLSSAP